MNARCCLFVLLGTLSPSLVWAQGVLLDQTDRTPRLPRVIRRIPPAHTQTYRIDELLVQVNLSDQIAKTQVSQSFVNTGSRPMEVCFAFPLPYDGAVDRMTFLVDGKEYPAQLLSAEEARRIYENYVRQNKDPALMEWMGTGMFKTSVFPVPPGAKRTVTLRYSQICRRFQGLTDWIFPLSTAKYTSEPIKRIKIEASVQSSSKITSLYSPTHDVTITRPGERLAKVVFEATDQSSLADFRLLYDVGDAEIAGRVLSYRPNSEEDGYLLMLLSPEMAVEGDHGNAKNIVFVVDRSGSMTGKKIEQAQAALEFVLRNLGEKDRFNIIAYDSAVESFRPELERVSEESRDAALGFVNGLYAGGSTNIDGALEVAQSMFTDSSVPNYLLFLTDGLPTAGERNIMKIVENARERNDGQARLISFGVGYDVNSRLLDKLSRTCLGQSQYVRPQEDIEAHVSQLYRRIQAPVLTGLEIGFDLENWDVTKGSPVAQIYPRDAYDLFAGDQLVLVGRYRATGAAKMTLTGQIRGEPKTYNYPVDLIAKSHDESYAFIEKIWASRRIGEIIDEIDLQGKNEELLKELVELSTRHGIITPYTSFLADENVNPLDLAGNRRMANDALGALQSEEGIAGFSQRAFKQSLLRSRQAPAPAVELQRVAEDRKEQVNNVRLLAGKTFYFRGGRWIDSIVSDKAEQKTVKVKLYSDSYFQLAQKHGKRLTSYLDLPGPLVVQLGVTTYEFTK